MCLISRGREFQTEGATAGREESDVEMLWFYPAECVEFLNQKQIGVVLIECTHEEV